MPTNKNMEMFEDQYGLHFSFSWMNRAAYFMAFFALFWNSFLVFWYLSAFAGGAPLETFLFPILHVIAGIGITYTVLTSFFNKTTIDLIDDELMIKHGPIPWFRGNQDVNINEIEQFYVREIRSQNNNSTTYNYGVWAIMMDGSRLDLTNGVTMTADYALVVEEKLETYLDIEDVPVKGAFGNVGNRKAIRKRKKKGREKPLDLDELKNRPTPEKQKRENWTDEDFV